jgi:hypothetical protein
LISASPLLEEGQVLVLLLLVEEVYSVVGLEGEEGCSAHLPPLQEEEEEEEEEVCLVRLLLLKPLLLLGRAAAATAAVVSPQ